MQICKDVEWLKIEVLHTAILRAVAGFGLACLHEDMIAQHVFKADFCLYFKTGVYRSQVITCIIRTPAIFLHVPTSGRNIALSG
ncbi:hypothetical protein U737_21325 [Methylomonas sp. LW13]|nr:hypothetical protein CWO84_18315 [Methylomonas sp. Kb3]QBC29248.1 hypothetical protein U737_21325 [Methylomonas sp. LW13]